MKRSTSMKFASISTILLAALTVGGSNARASATLTAPNEEQRCAMINPDENGNPSPKLGISKGDLRRLASTSEMNYRWVQWYIGTQNSMDEALKSVPPQNLRALVPKVAKCESIDKFKEVINKSLYELPKLECIGGSYNYRFRVIGDTVDMELVEVVAPPTTAAASAEPNITYVRALSREPVELAAGTAGGSCALRISQKRQSARALKICLPTSDLTGEGSGAVSMNQGGHPIAQDSRDLACKADPGFAEAARPVIKSLQPQAPSAPAISANATASSPASSSPSGSPAAHTLATHANQ